MLLSRRSTQQVNRILFAVTCALLLCSTVVAFLYTFGGRGLLIEVNYGTVHTYVRNWGFAVAWQILETCAQSWFISVQAGATEPSLMQPETLIAAGHRPREFRDKVPVRDLRLCVGNERCLIIFQKFQP